VIGVRGTAAKHDLKPETEMQSAPIDKSSYGLKSPAKIFTGLKIPAQNERTSSFKSSENFQPPKSQNMQKAQNGVYIPPKIRIKKGEKFPSKKYRPIQSGEKVSAKMNITKRWVSAPGRGHKLLLRNDFSL
jgi:hypothetical protein